MSDAAATVEIRAAELPRVAIVGRPNVGKSTLFNRLVRRRQAIVRGEPGTTRDRNYGNAEWRGRHFTVIDTGGLLGEQLTGPYAEPVASQVQQAVREADAIVLVVDVQAGVVPADAEVADLLRRVEQPVTVCVNKADNERYALSIDEFFGLGLGDPIAISAHHGRYIDDLLDRVIADLPESAPDQPEQVACRLAIIGRPERGQIVAGQRPAARRPNDRERGAWHHARRDRYRADLRRQFGGARRHSGHQAPRARRAGR